MNETSSKQLGRAIKIASKLHYGQIDKAGEPYILHPIAVMLKCSPVHEVMMVAILHDLIEDCDINITHLRSLGFPEIVCTGVEAMTRHVISTDGKIECRMAKKGDRKEEYQTFIARIAQNPIACIVKMKDIEHNLSPERLNKLQYNELPPNERKHNELLLRLRIEVYRRSQGELYHFFAGACLKYYGGMI